MNIFDLLFNFKTPPSKIQHTENITSIIKYSLTYILENKSTRRLFVSFFFLQFALGIYVQSLSLLLITAFLYTPQTIGVLMIVNSIVTIVSMYILQPFITRYCKYISQTRISLGLISLLFILYAIYSIYASHDLEEYKIFSLITLLLANIFLPFITLGFTNLFANSVDKFAQGRVMGGYGQIASLATIISGLISGKILSVNFSIVIVLSCVALIISYVLLKSYLFHNCTIRKYIC